MKSETQKAYEKIRKWFMRPNAVFGYDAERDSCVYRRSGNAFSRCRCAVGVLIPSRQYDDQLEDFEPGGIPLEDYGFGGADLDFLRKAQSVHDYCATNPHMEMPDFIEKLDQLAAIHGLEVVA